MKSTSNVKRRKSDVKRSDMINIRATTRERALIDQAAASQGKTRSDFMLEAAHREAVDAILNQTLFHVDAKVYSRFVAMLDAPARSNQNLRKLMATKAPWE